jgi:FAD/FMN-containing dehydrogenase
MSLLASNPTMVSIVRRLRAAVDGRIITPGNATYDQARTIFYGEFDQRPAVIVRPTTASEVAQVVSLARETGWSSPSAAAATASPATAPPTAGSCWTSRR